MFTVILIGNSQSYEADGKFITPRGYYGEIKMKTDVGIGQDIMIRSFRTIEKELKNKEIPLDKKWALLHAIHTTADFDMENILRIDDHAVASLYGKFSRGEVRTIITDVTMAASRHPQRSFAAYGNRSEMLFAGRAHRTTCNRKRDHPHTGRHPACRTGTSRRSICIRQCADRINGTL